MVWAREENLVCMPFMHQIAAGKILPRDDDIWPITVRNLLSHSLVLQSYLDIPVSRTCG